MVTDLKSSIRGPWWCRYFDQEMPPGFTSAICLRHNFVHVSTLENRVYKSIGQNFQSIVLDNHANFREKLS